MTAVWAGLIFYLSTEGYGASFTQWLLHEVLHLLGIRVSRETFETLHHLVRKAAHVTEYAFFSTFIYHALSADGSFRWRWGLGFKSLLLAAAYSLTDEFHQVFVPGRTASILDSGIDTTGAAIALALIYLAHRRGPSDQTAAPAAQPT